MSKFNYALDRQEYTLNNALFWGNCVGHYEKAKHASWGPRMVHVIIVILEYLPVVGQIASIFEMVIVRCCGSNVPPNLELQKTSPHSSLTVTPEASPNKTLRSSTLNLEGIPAEQRVGSQIIGEGSIELNGRKEGEKTPRKNIVNDNLSITASQEIISSSDGIPGET